MSLDAPAFWSRGRERDWRSQALAPLGQVYHRIVQHRLKRPGEEPPVPVVCIGNATVGGVGKTPFVRMLAQALSDKGCAVHVLTRGYGGKEKGPHRVQCDDTAVRVGDEPLMLSTTLPVWVSADRAAGARAAAADGADVILMDDGFQNPSLQKSRSVMLIDRDALFGNGLVFPAGPLREKPAAAAARADAFVLVGGSGDEAFPDELSEIVRGKPHFRAWFELETSSIPDGPLFAFCGIGRPERFRTSLVEHGATLCKFEAFPDHHPFSIGELKTLRRLAEASGASLVTTEKDFVRLAPTDRDGITPIRGVMRVSDETALLRLVEDVL